MIFVLAALLPTVLILMLGKMMAHYKRLSEEGWRGLETITYYILFPALIVSKLAVADFSDVSWQLPTTLIGAQFVMAGLSIGLGKLSNQSPKRLGVFVQSGVRFNTFIALAVAQGLMGSEGLLLTAVAASIMIPVANALSIFAFLGFSDTRMGVSELTYQILVNPLIIACVVGLVLNQLNLEIVSDLLGTLDVLGQATIAIGLLATGAHVTLKAGKAPLSMLTIWSLLRLLVLPLIALTIAYILNIAPHIMLVILIITAVPTAANGAILARKLGGDAQLAANITALQSLLALFTITGLLWAASAAQLIPI